jgi:hypothetical protein
MLARPVTHVARPVLDSAAINAGQPSAARAAETVSEQVANSLKRFAVSSWMPLKYDADGALHLYFQNAGPAPTRRQTGSRRRGVCLT